MWNGQWIKIQMNIFLRPSFYIGESVFDSVLLWLRAVNSLYTCAIQSCSRSEIKVSQLRFMCEF